MKITLYSLILCSILAACSDEGSSLINNPPRIISFEILNSNSQILIEEGAQLQFSYELSDDKALNQFRVTIYDDFPNARLFSAPWNYEEEIKIYKKNVD